MLYVNLKEANKEFEGKKNLFICIVQSLVAVQYMFIQVLLFAQLQGTNAAFKLHNHQQAQVEVGAVILMHN